MNSQQIAEAISPLVAEVVELEAQLQELRRELKDVALPATVMRRVEGLLEQARSIAEKSEVDAELVLRGYVAGMPGLTSVAVVGDDALLQVRISVHRGRHFRLMVDGISA